MNRQVYELVKEVVQPTRRRSMVSVEYLANRLRVSARLLYAWGEPDGKHKFPAELVGPITALTGDTLLIQHLANECGGAFVPFGDGTLNLNSVSQAVSEFGRLLTAYSEGTHPESQAGAHFSRSEAEALSEAARGAITAILQVQAEVEADVQAFRMPRRPQTMAEAEG